MNLNQNIQTRGAEADQSAVGDLATMGAIDLDFTLEAQEGSAEAKLNAISHEAARRVRDQRERRIVFGENGFDLEILGREGGRERTEKTDASRAIESVAVAFLEASGDHREIVNGIFHLFLRGA